MLVNDRRCPGEINAFLRTDGYARPAAGAARTHIVSRRFLRRLPDGDAVPDDVRRVADVEILSITVMRMIS